MSRLVLTIVLLLFLVFVPASGAKRWTLIDTAFTVEPGAFRFWEFRTGDRNSAGVFGSFRAQGGRNDIELYVMDDVQFENWRNGHATQTYYSSGRLTVARFALRLPPGRFFVVFNNRYSVVTNKAVRAKVFFDDGY